MVKKKHKNVLSLTFYHRFFCGETQAPKTNRQMSELQSIKMTWYYGCLQKDKIYVYVNYIYIIHIDVIYQEKWVDFPWVCQFLARFSIKRRWVIPSFGTWRTNGKKTRTCLHNIIAPSWPPPYGPPLVDVTRRVGLSWFWVRLSPQTNKSDWVRLSWIGGDQVDFE